MDEDLERTTFIVGTGVIGPLDIVSIVISTTLELPTLENGAIRIVYPALLTPIVTGQMTSGKSENGGKSDENGFVSNLNSYQTIRVFSVPSSDKGAVKIKCYILLSSLDLPAVLVPPQGNKTGPWTWNSNVPIPSSPVQLPTWHHTNSTSSWWSEEPAY